MNEQQINNNSEAVLFHLRNTLQRLLDEANDALSARPVATDHLGRPMTYWGGLASPGDVQRESISWADFWIAKGRPDVAHDFDAFTLADEWRNATRRTEPDATK